MGLFLRCPRCEKGSISDGLFRMRKTCSVCGVPLERKSGESAGASIIWLSVLPIFALMLFFIMYFIDDSLPRAVLLGVPLGFVLIVGILFYRNVRGLWVAITYLTGGIYMDPPDADG